MTTTPRVDTTRLQHVARAYGQTAILYAAIDLEIFTHIARGASTIEEVAHAVGISALNAERLVVCCAGLGLVTIDAHSGTLANAPDVARFLVLGEPGYAGAWMQFTRHEVPEWFRLTELLRSTEAPRRLGMYETLTVERARKYHEATASIGMGAGRRFARTVDMSGRRLLLDLGGGSGGYSIAAVQAYPELHAAVLDLPPVVVVTAEYLARAAVTDRVSTVGADFTADPFPQGVDVVVMASNLPIYDEKVIALVVAKAYGALQAGGEMHLVGEMLDDDRSGPLDASLWGMQEIFYGSGGKAHTVAQCIGYFRSAGFVDVVMHDFVPGVLRRVTGRKV